MTGIKKVNDKILSFFDKIFAFFDKVSRKKFFWLVFGLIVLVLTTIFWAIFVNLNPTNGPIVYDKVGLNNSSGITYSDGDKIYSNYYNFISQFKYSSLNIIIGVLLGITLLIFIYLLINKRINSTRLIVFLCIIAYIIRIGYMGFVDVLQVHQHDTFSSNQYGHVQITFHVYYTGKPSPVVEYYPGTTIKLPTLADCLDRSYQLYHTKFYCYIFAGWMRIMSIFVKDNQFLLASSMKIVSCFMSMAMVVISIGIFKQLKMSKVATAIATGIIVAMPTFVILAGNGNNDTATYFFTWLAIYYAIKYFNYKKTSQIIWMGVFIGLAMGCKISGGLLALPIGLMLIYMLVKFIQAKDYKKLIKDYLLFIVVCAPIGLFWTLYNKYVYGYPIGYMWSVTNDYLKIDPKWSFFDRFIFLDFNMLFKTPFVHLGGVDQDYSTIIFLLKSQLFGEWSMPENMYGICYFALVIELIFLMGMIIALLYFIIRQIARKEKDWLCYYGGALFLFYGAIFVLNTKQIYISIILILIGAVLFGYSLYKNKGFRNKKFVFVYLTGLTFIISYIGFNIKEPFVCTQDIRYLVPMLLCIAIGSGYLLDKIFKKEKKAENNIVVKQEIK